MNLTKKDISNYNLIFLFISIIWKPLQTYYLHFDGKGLTLVFLAIVAILLNIGYQRHCREVFRSPGFVCWTLLLLYSMVNVLFTGFYPEDGPFLFFRYHFVEPWLFLTFAIVEIMHDKERCLHVILVALLIYMFMGSRHFVLWDVDNTRIVAEGLGNTLPLRGVTALFVSSVLFVNKKLKGGKWFYGAIVLFTLYIIIITSTRKAMGASTILLIGMLVSRVKGFGVRTIVTYITIVLLAIVGIDFIMDNTYMGQRNEEAYETIAMEDIELSSNPKVNDLLTRFLGDRTIQYYLAIRAHKQYPLTGIGIGNFQNVTGFAYRLHSEYMVHYCENGLIGFSIFLLYYLMLFVGLRKKRKEGQNTRIYLFGLLAIMFLNFTSWTYNNTGIMIMYAIILTFVYSKEPWPSEGRKRASASHR